MNLQTGLIAEFSEQTYVQIIFPHAQTDWVEYLEEAEKTFIHIIEAVQTFQGCKIICADVNAVKKHFKNKHNLEFVAYTSDDTWARDCSAITISKEGHKELLDFTFNAWGNKFEATRDNAMTAFLTPHAKPYDFVLEGGAIESNGEGILLTTTATMYNPNRNPHLTKAQITQKLKDSLQMQEILYLEHGFLAGDDTDSHIDTLVRFITNDTLMYVQCLDPQDIHYKALQLMEKELQALAKKHHFKLIALPMAEAVYFQNERLPATYANFLFLNNALLLPSYNTKTDEKVITIFEKTFPNRKIIPIDCSILIRQHGSLHCVSMNFYF